MDDSFKIYVDQLREGQEEKLQEALEPGFLDIHEKELSFETPVQLEGKAYTADRELVLHWNIATKARVVCSVCNDSFEIPIEVNNFYHCEPLSEIKTGIYDYKELLREIILLEVPAFAECCGGNCPKRQEYGKYLKKASDLSTEEEGYHPFADLDWKS